MIADRIQVSDDAFAGLLHQRGALWDLRDDRAAWELAYRRDLARIYHAMAPALPVISNPWVLDIGAGMGGLDLLLWRHYRKRVRLSLLDGLGAAQPCETHNQPFGDVKAAERFLVANGVREDHVDLIDPAVLWPWSARFDVVISTRAWGFHFAPEPYLAWALKAATPEAVFIIDIRRGRVAWLAEFIAALGKPTFLARDPKSDLVGFRC